MQKRNGFTTAEKKLMMLPDETQEGLKITGKTVLINHLIVLAFNELHAHYAIQ